MRSKSKSKEDETTVSLLQPETVLTQGKRRITVELLTRERIELAVSVKECRVKDVLGFLFEYLDVGCRPIFGLTRKIDGEHRFQENDAKISKILPKEWKQSSGKNGSTAHLPMQTFYLRVQVFVDEIRQICDDISLEHYYLQLRENLRLQWDSPKTVPEERVTLAVTLALAGDPIAVRGDQHLRVEEWWPKWIIEKHGSEYLEESMTSLLPPSPEISLKAEHIAESRRDFCRAVCEKPCGLNQHIYRGLRRPPKQGGDACAVGIQTWGLEVWKTDPPPTSTQILLLSLPWSRLGKIAHERRRFVLASTPPNAFEIVLMAQDETTPKHLFQLSKTVHATTMKLGRRDVALYDRAPSRDSSPSHHLILEQAHLLGHTSSCRDPLHGASGLRQGQLQVGQRVSVVSDASSNTTSGIVSDKQHADTGSDVEESDHENLIIDSALSLEFDNLQNCEQGTAYLFHPSSVVTVEYGGFRASLPALALNKKHSSGANSCSDGGTLGGATTSSEDSHSVATTERGPDDPDTSTLEPDDEQYSALPATPAPVQKSKNGVLRVDISATPVSTASASVSPMVSAEIAASLSRPSPMEVLPDDHLVDGDSLLRRQNRIRISELRERTLPSDYDSPKVPRKRPDPLPLVSSPYLKEGSEEEKSKTHEEDTREETKEMKSLATQTGGSLGFRPRELKPSILVPPPPLSTNTSDTGLPPHGAAAPHGLSPGSHVAAFPGSQLPPTQSRSTSNLNGYVEAPLPAFVEPPQYHQAIRRKSLAPPPCTNNAGQGASNRPGGRWPSSTDLETIVAQLARLPELQQANSEPRLSSGHHESIGGMMSIVPPNLPAPPAAGYLPQREPFRNAYHHHALAGQPDAVCHRCVAASALRSRSSNWLNQIPPGNATEFGDGYRDDINTILAAYAFRQFVCGQQPPARPSYPSPNGGAPLVASRRTSPNGGAAHMILRNQSDSPRKRSGRIVRTQSVNADQTTARRLRQRHDQHVADTRLLECRSVPPAPSPAVNDQHAALGPPSNHRPQCSCCHETHSRDPSMDFERVKDICRNLPDNLPLVKALASDPNIGKRPASLATSAVAEAVRSASPQPASPPNGRPISWHEAAHQLRTSNRGFDYPELPPPPPYDPRKAKALPVT